MYGSIYTNSSYHSFINNVDTAATHEMLDAQPEERSKGERTDVNSASGCDDKNKVFQGRDTQKTLR